MATSPTIFLSNKLRLSRIVHGHWRLAQWELRGSQLLSMLSRLIDWGVTSFDHADIYGNHSCEKIFGDALALSPSLREKMQIITKCGIKLNTDKFPDRKVKIYDYSKSHIIASAEQSLKNFRTDRLDLLLLHRPAPFFDPHEVAEAFTSLKKQGKVLHFGVSNFTAGQINMLQSYMGDKLVTNQVEISPLCLDEFENGNMDLYLKERMSPMAWSPLAGGRIFKPRDKRDENVLAVIREIASELDVLTHEVIVYTWLLKHPSNIIPVVGSGKPDRIRSAVDALSVDMSLEQWYRIYIAAKGAELP